MLESRRLRGFMRARFRNSAFSLVELLVVLGIFAVLVSLLLPAIQLAREVATTAECKNNLKQVGLGVALYHDAMNAYPKSSKGNYSAEDREHLFYKLKTYLEQKNNDGTIGFRTFLCPSRRGPAVGARADFAVPANLMMGADYIDPARYPSSLVPIIADAYCGSAGGEWVSVSMGQITDGLANTLLMAHKGVEPQYYFNPAPAVFTRSVFQSPPNPGVTFLEYAPSRDIDWSTPAAWDYLNGWDITRYPYCMLRDRDGGYDLGQVSWYPQTVPCHELFTSPHKNGMPCVFGDASVRTLAYSKSHTFFQPYAEMGTPTAPTQQEDYYLRLWYGNDGGTLSIEEI